MNGLDEAIVFFDPEALKIKGRAPIAVEDISTAFDHPNLTVFTTPAELHQYLFQKEYSRTALLMMSSGNYGSLDWEKLSELIVSF